MKVLFLCVAHLVAALALNNGLGLTPQMGWNSWNYYACQVNESNVREAADFIVSSGLADLGYVYVNVDDCWAYSRDREGVIQADPRSFPHGMGALAKYVHSLGLFFGLYSDTGAKTCAGRPGSLGHELIDALTYASWGVDYLKLDNCNMPAPPAEQYPVMRDALNATGHTIFFSMCDWGVTQPWQWAGNVGNSWRTTGDIQDRWEDFIRVLDNNIGLSPYAHPGAWNDADMLEVGNGGMIYVEYRSHFALWCLLKAPLMIGTDLMNMDNDTYFILSSVELIAVNQDRLGAQGDLVYRQGYIYIWAGPLEGGSRAFVLQNRGTMSWYDTKITIPFELMGFPKGTKGTVRDLYARKNIGVFTDSFTFSVAPHDVFAGSFVPEDDVIRQNYADWKPILFN